MAINESFGELRTYEMFRSETIQQWTNNTWANNDNMAHTITSGTAREGPNGYFNSDLIKPGESFTFSFDELGNFDYFCMIHPWETASITVNEGTNQTSIESTIESINEPTIPSWVKLIFKGWIDGIISEQELIDAISFLVKTGVIPIQ